MNRKYLLVIEIVWIATGLLCIAAAVRYLTISGGPRVFIFIAMAIVSFLFAFVRHRERKKP